MPKLLKHHADIRARRFQRYAALDATIDRVSHRHTWSETNCEGNPEGSVGIRKLEACLHHAHDRVRRLVEGHRPSENVCVPVKKPQPRTVAEDHDELAARVFVA